MSVQELFEQYKTNCKAVSIVSEKISKLVLQKTSEINVDLEIRIKDFERMEILLAYENMYLSILFMGRYTDEQKKQDC